MFETSRRSKISTSELGLYSDRSERSHCHTSGYGTVVVKQFVVVVMIIITVLLIALYVYDVTSSTSILRRPSFETRHLHIYRASDENKSNSFEFLNSAPEGNKNEEQTSTPSTLVMQDRSDPVDYHDDEMIEKEIENRNLDLESRAQTLRNYQLRKKLLSQLENDRDSDEKDENVFSNHALIYRIKPSPKKITLANSEDRTSDASDPSPFQFEFKTPYPASFKRLKYPQLTQYRYPHASRSIQDIIKYVMNDPSNRHRGIKFTGVYLSPKKYSSEEAEEANESTLDENESDAPPVAVPNTGDPLYRYKPKHPAEVNLLAPSNFRFSPMGIQRFGYNNWDPYFTRPEVPYLKPSLSHIEPDSYSLGNININTVSSSQSSKKRKAKPFSVMLDIYPITDINEYQSSKSGSSGPRQPPEPDYDSRRPMNYKTRFPSKHLQIPLALPNRHNPYTDEEKQQMILHLNLYPRKKDEAKNNNRNYILQQSENKMTENISKKPTSPLNELTNQLSNHLMEADEKLEESERRNLGNSTLEPVEDISKMYLQAQNVSSTTEKSDASTMATICEKCLESTTQDVGSSTKFSPTVLPAEALMAME